MSQDRFGETTRRAFLGTATAATAASLTAAHAGEPQGGVGTDNPAGPIKLAQADADVPDVTCQGRRLDQAGGYGNPKGGIFTA